MAADDHIKSSYKTLKRELDQVISSTERLSVKVQQDSLFVDLTH